MRRLAVVIGVMSLTACASPTPSATATPTTGAAPTTVELPTLADWNGGCLGLGINAQLHGDPEDRRVAWLVESDRDPARRRDLVWPPGFRAQFTPDLVILDDEGKVVAMEGDQVDGVCGITGEPDYLVLIPIDEIRR